MGVEVGGELEDVEEQRDTFFGHDVAGEVLEDDVGEVAELVFDVAVVFLKLVDGVAFRLFTFVQFLNIRKNCNLFILKVFHHLFFVVYEKFLQSIAMNGQAGIGDFAEVVFDMGDAFIEVIVVGGDEVGDEGRHVGAGDFLLCGQVFRVGIYVANQQEEAVGNAVLLAHFADAFLAEAELDVESLENQHKTMVRSDHVG